MSEQGPSYDLRFQFTVAVPLYDLMELDYLQERGKKKEAARRLADLHEGLRRFVVGGMDGQLGELIFRVVRRERAAIREAIQRAEAESPEEKMGLPPEKDAG